MAATTTTTKETPAVTTTTKAASTGNEPGAVDTAATRPTPKVAATGPVANPVQDAFGSPLVVVVSKDGNTYQTAKVCQLLESLVASVTTVADCDTLANLVADALEQRAKVLGGKTAKVTPPAPVAKLEPTPMAIAAKTPAVPAPVAVAKPAKDTYPTTYAALIGRGQDEVKAIAATLGVDTKLGWLKLASATWKAIVATKVTPTAPATTKVTPPAKVEAQTVTPPAPIATTKATAPAKGTLLVADGKGGVRPATLEELYAALEAMTAPATKLAA